MEFITHSAVETEQLGARLAAILQAGDVMVIEGFQRVRAGMTVKPVPYAGPAAPKTPAGGGA